MRVIELWQEPRGDAEMKEKRHGTYSMEQAAPHVLSALTHGGDCCTSASATPTRCPREYARRPARPDAPSRLPTTTPTPFLALNLRNGAIVWADHTLSSDAFTGTCAQPGVTCGPDFDFGSAPNLFTTTNPETGGTAVDLGFVSAANGVVYAGSNAGTGNNMYALDAATGKILFSFASGGAVVSGAAVVGGSVYRGSGYYFSTCPASEPACGNNDKLYAFALR
jgi:outer membrane protein assembly factor BamB